jgi:hypothetical protein
MPAAVTAGGTKPADAQPLADAVECRPRDALPNVLEKLRAGGEVRIAYFGGSITAQEGWRVKTLKWFQEQFPKAKVSEINAAIGGTGSDLGAFRFRQDVLELCRLGRVPACRDESHLLHLVPAYSTTPVVRGPSRAA